MLPAKINIKYQCCHTLKWILFISANKRFHWNVKRSFINKVSLVNHYCLGGGANFPGKFGGTDFPRKSRFKILDFGDMLWLDCLRNIYNRNGFIS